MQSDLTKSLRVNKKETPASKFDIMTFGGKHRTPSSPILPETVSETLFSNDDALKYEGINLEDDIEKVEVSSAFSSEDEDFSCDLPENILPKYRVSSPVHQENPENIKIWLKKISEMQNEISRKITIDNLSLDGGTHSNKPPPPVTQSRVVKYQDLPYMGEITLDNSKPRRGRKPKKADICHLIYKNYGTIFPGTPNATNLVGNKKKVESNKSDVQNRIISSLLEKRLTQEEQTKKTKQLQKLGTTLARQGPLKQNEPLNLCLRDTSLDIIKNESDDSSRDSPKSDSWAPQFFPHMSLEQQLMYYQRLANQNIKPVPDAIPIEVRKKAIPKIRPKVPSAPSSPEITYVPIPKQAKRANGSEAKSTKRKRSAIFIPPIQSENTTNPATEVSICKFKFTGGAKPSLQEKKMLSVDAGGNFRYYSGTGDKSMRGYEFFPRETLQQQANSAQGSSTGAFLQASGEKIYPTASTSDPNETKIKSEFLLTPELPPSAINNLNEISQREQTSNSKKRKSRKSVQREKLEQTFKEKGFLIQTQQLESAEGATYCKFRQLRKFTRYLFRSWKDYLPGNVAEGDLTPEERQRLLNEEMSERDLEEQAHSPLSIEERD